MRTGVLPFDADDASGWAAQHILAAPRSFDATEGGRRVPGPVRRVIERAMAKNPADRPSTVRELRRELNDAFASGPTRTVIDIAASEPMPAAAVLPPPAPPPRSRRPRRSLARCARCGELPERRIAVDRAARAAAATRAAVALGASACGRSPPRRGGLRRLDGRASGSPAHAAGAFEACAVAEAGRTRKGGDRLETWLARLRSRGQSALTQLVRRGGASVRTSTTAASR